jgi:hypothetical protein
MKKFLIVLSLLLVTVTPAKETKGQVTQNPPQNEFSQSQSYTKTDFELGGETPYETYPEFTGIISTTVTIPAQNTGDGYLFITPLSQGNEIPPAIAILDDNGEPIYIRALPQDKFVGDFKVQRVNGTDYLTYHSGILPSGYTFGLTYVMDNSYEVVDTWTMEVGSGSDVHDFLLLDNGHAVLIAYVPIPYDLSPYGGPENGTLVDVVLQEQDADKNVVFEWHASHHLPIGDTEMNLNTTDPVDYLHTNAVEVDEDGNWLLSHRNFSEITKINRQTGDVIWRMGGKGNEFTFTNDIGFWNQHDVRRLDNGNITIFDNGNQHTPPHSRAVEYTIDEAAKTVTRVWMYPDDTEQFVIAMGNFQRLFNGNSLIGWGTLPEVSEVRPNGTVAFEMRLGTPNYRAFRFPWSATPAELPRAALKYNSDPTAVTLYSSWNGATDIVSYDVYAGTTKETMSLITNVPRDGFETIISLTGLPPDTCFFQTKPVHEQGVPTPLSALLFRVDIPICWDQLTHSFIPAGFW